MDKNQVTFGSYIIGYILSFGLTILTFFLVIKHVDSGHVWLPHPLILYIILGLAVIQFIVQAIFFLHLGKESAPRSNLLIFLSTISLILIIVAGSLWIMNNLNYHMMPDDINSYIFHEEGIEK